MALLPHLLHISADQHARLMLSQAFAQSGLAALLDSLSSASNTLLYLNGLGPFKGFPRPQLIILDVDLPHTEGTDFLHMLRTNTRFKSITTCVLMTSLTEPDIERCRTLAIDHCRLKPRTQQDASELVSVVKAWLQGSPHAS